MPKGPKISHSQRRGWLTRHENGELLDGIAKADGVNPRTVRNGIEKARKERGYENALNEQLRKSLDLHQQEMLDLVSALKGIVHTPKLKQYGMDRPDFKLEHFVVEKGEHRIKLNPGVHITVGADGSVEVNLEAQDSRLFECLKEHLSKTAVMRYLAEWQRLLQKEEQARVALIKQLIPEVETVFKKPVGIADPFARDIVTSNCVGFIRVEATKLSMGEPLPDIIAKLHIDDDQYRNHHIVASGVKGRLVLDSKDPETDRKKINWLITETAKTDEASHAAHAYRELEASTQKTLDEIEDYLLMHHIPGQCRLCKKLGGR